MVLGAQVDQEVPVLSKVHAFSAAEEVLADFLLRALTGKEVSHAVNGHVAMALLEIRLANLEWRDGLPSALRGGLSARQIQLACQQLRGEVDLRIAGCAAARACRISRGHFSRAFKVSMGMTPRRFHIEQRVLRAQQLLEERELPIADIAIECGFSDQSHFTNTFSRLRRQTPAAWRRQATAKNLQEQAGRVDGFTALEST